MFKNILKGTAREQGFTLIELLVVILIIGILLAVAIPSFLNQTSKANVSAIEQQINTVYEAAKSEATSNNGYYPWDSSSTPPSLEEVTLDQAILSSEPELADVLCYSGDTNNNPNSASTSSPNTLATCAGGSDGSGGQLPGPGKVSVSNTTQTVFNATGAPNGGGTITFSSDTGQYMCTGVQNVPNGPCNG